MRRIPTANGIFGESAAKTDGNLPGQTNALDTGRNGAARSSEAQSLPEIRPMVLSCPIHMPVSVSAYQRFRFGKWEDVRAHCRGLPNRYTVQQLPLFQVL